MFLELHSSETDGYILECNCGCKFRLIWRLFFSNWLAAVSAVEGTMWMRKIPNYRTWPALRISLSNAKVVLLIQRINCIFAVRFQCHLNGTGDKRHCYEKYFHRSHVHISSVVGFVIKRIFVHQSLLFPTCSSYPGQVTTDEYRISWNTGSVLPLSLGDETGGVICSKDKAAGNTDNKLKILDLSCKIVPYVYY